MQQIQPGPSWGPGPPPTGRNQPEWAVSTKEQHLRADSFQNLSVRGGGKGMRTREGEGSKFGLSQVHEGVRSEELQEMRGILVQEGGSLWPGRGMHPSLSGRKLGWDKPQSQYPQGSGSGNLRVQS